MGCTSSSAKHGKRDVPAVLENTAPAQSKPDVKAPPRYPIEDFKPTSFAKILDPNDYGIVSYLQEGGMGKVYQGLCKSTGEKVALKFFGYTYSEPSMADITAEINMMDFLNGTSGIINFHGIFLDEPDGFIENKNHKVAYPVIVMELLEGGELSERIYNRSSVSERYLAKIFKKMALILVELGKQRIVHRDIKLENIMLVGEEEDSPIKIIDFGLMIHIPENSETYTSYTLKGTNGCFAPESVIESVYSVHSDVWQAGCTLYSMLSGLAPYDPDKMHQITHGSYFEMKGVGWDNISDSAKDLVQRTLLKDPRARITAAEILTHPWIVSEAPDDDLGSEYALRVKQLALRQKLRSFFLDHNITRTNNDRRNKIRAALPFLANLLEVEEQDEEDDGGDERRSIERQASNEFNGKLKNLKRVIVGSWSKHNSAILGASPQTPVSSKSESNIAIIKRARANSCGPLVEVIERPLVGSSRSFDEMDKVKQKEIVMIGSPSSLKSVGSPEDRTHTKALQDAIVKLRRLSSADQGAVPARRFSSGNSEGSIKMRRYSSSSEYDAKSPVRRPSGAPKLTGKGLALVTTITDSADPEETEDSEYILPPGAITFVTFEQVMKQCGLPELADLSVFNIFDIGSKGSIDMKEFLLTMVAFRPGVAKIEESEEDSAAKLYFQIFDIDETGYISQDELKLAVSCLLHLDERVLEDGKKQDESYDGEDSSMTMPNRSISEVTHSSAPELEALFDIIDVDKSGRINFEEFKSFYNTVLHHTSVRRAASSPILVVIDTVDEEEFTGDLEYES